jgi:hypothetical protein
LTRSIVELYASTNALTFAFMAVWSGPGAPTSIITGPVVVVRLLSVSSTPVRPLTVFESDFSVAPPSIEYSAWRARRCLAGSVSSASWPPLAKSGRPVFLPDSTSWPPTTEAYAGDSDLELMAAAAAAASAPAGIVMLIPGSAGSGWVRSSGSALVFRLIVVCAGFVA